MMVSKTIVTIPQPSVKVTSLMLATGTSPKHANVESAGQVITGATQHNPSSSKSTINVLPDIVALESVTVNVTVNVPVIAEYT